MATLQPGIEELGPAPGAASPDYEVSLVSLNQWQLAWKRFKKHHMAVIGTGMLLAILAMGLTGFAMSLTGIFDPISVPVPIKGCGSGCPPSFAAGNFHIFGTTGGLQRDVFQLVVVGSWLSLLIGIGASLIAAFIGAVVGGVAGYFGGWTDGLLMRVCDVLLSLPLLFVILVVANFVGQGRGDWYTVMLVFAVFGWAGLGRLVRSVFLSLRGETFVDAARAVGVSSTRIIFKHILPNSISPIIVATTLSIAAVIVGEAFVSYLGFGVNPLTPTWGNVLSNAQNYLAQGNWWWAFFPGFFIVVTVLAVNFMGDGLRDALDPRARL
ncbi:MAG: ABC transporter permease [Candidatus Limnocylindrales bacterium]